MTASEANIVNGPSKFDLMIALFVREPFRPVVRFTSEIGTVWIAYVGSCQSETPDGEYWVVKGWTSRESSIDTDGSTRIIRGKQYEIYFCTKTRKGHLIFL